MDRRNYIEILSGQIRCKRAVPLVTRELEGHIEEQKEAFMAEGMTEREAEEAAVREMGDPVEVGVDMDRIHRPKMNWSFIIFIGILSLMGLGIQYYMDVHIMEKDMPFLYYPVKYFAYTAAGFFVMLGVCYVDYTRIAYRAKELLLLYSLCLSVGTIVSGGRVNGARQFIRIGGLFLNLRMAVLLLIPLYCAVLYSYRGQGRKGMVKGIIWMCPVLISLLISSSTELIILTPVLAIILSVAVYKKYFQVPVKKTLIGIWGVMLLLPFAGAAFILKFGSDYQIMRLRVMLEPSEYAMGEGYQFCAVRSLLEGSKIIGHGENLGNVSVPVSTSFVLTYVTAYFGILAAVLIIGVILAVFWKLMTSALKQQNQMGMLIGVGCGAAIISNIVWYVLINMGVVIAGYSYCPFITCGGSGAVVTYILIGVMLSIYRYQNVSPVEMPGKMFAKRKCQE